MTYGNILRVAIGLVLIIEGIDKYFNKLAEWPVYSAPLILDILPITHGEFLSILGITEVIVGIVFIIKARFGGLLAAMLMFGIVINLLLRGDYYNIALLNTIIGLACLSISQSVRLVTPPPLLPPPLPMKKSGKNKKK